MTDISRRLAWIVVYLCTGVWRYLELDSNTVLAFLLYNFCLGDWAKLILVNKYV